MKRDEDHLARLSLADLFLDTLPYNAHATASDALWVGVPVLTVAGASFPGRVATSLLHAVGMADLVAPSLAAYEARVPVQAGVGRGREDQVAFNRRFCMRDGTAMSRMKVTAPSGG